MCFCTCFFYINIIMYACINYDYSCSWLFNVIRNKVLIFVFLICFMLSCYINHANNVLLLILMHSVRGNQRGNHEWTFQRYWQQCSHMAQDEDKQSTKTIQYRKLKRWATRIPIKIWGEPILLAKDIDLYTLICIVRYQSNIHKTPVKYKFLKLKISLFL